MKTIKEVELEEKNKELQDRINKAIEYIRSEYTITDDDAYLALYSSDGTLDKLESILKGDNK
jgi:methionine synthase II (cobalamin-independent)